MNNSESKKEETKRMLALVVFIVVILGVIAVVLDPESIAFFLGMGGFIYVIPIAALLSVMMAISASGSSSIQKDPKSFSAKSPFTQIMLIVASVGLPLLAVGLLLAIALGEM